ncbi:mitochondrial TIM23 translocase of inner membrane Tim50 subunit [Andalucia godoyi]|uniref:Mitochondrial import inner membrane translocase subunit TIM50 n=1 Tax=Andalucia godoyi TaxID=505711 RepID=A0A8K0AIB3_ANDGO|nr:mitochondrial TIM23 translocase of inner membrane Tim50 subunit [Andalucia godoyi]|eukprot:ANDGO_02963.mRNA.1 mitochondrial TIM23 translocase of inner membrane Tim50 subunit
MFRRGFATFTQAAVDEMKRVRRMPTSQPGLSTVARAVRWTLGLSAIGGFGFAVYDFSQDSSILREPLKKLADDADKLLSGVTPYDWVRKQVSDVDEYIHRPISKKLLPDLPPPPPGYVNKPTLIVGVEGVLVIPVYERGRGFRYQKRPNVDLFLSEMSKYYEVVFFSSDTVMSVAPILEKLNHGPFASGMLFRDALDVVGEKVYVKDLSNLNRDLSRTVLVDADLNAWQRQPENAIGCSWWEGDLNDNQLQELSYYLRSLALQPGDLRKTMGPGKTPEQRMADASRFAEIVRKREIEIAEEKKRQQQRAQKSIFARH